MDQLQYNEDGSVDLYVGVDAPEGDGEQPPRHGGRRGRFVYFRLYAPEQAFFDKTFTLPDFETTE